MKRSSYPRLKETDIITCRDCGWPDEAWWFGVVRYENRLTRQPIYYQPCPMCRQTNGDEAKRKDRTVQKSNDLISRKAKKFVKTREDLFSLYGWPSVNELAELIKRTYMGNCHYCWNPYVEMEHGFGDVTLDQINRAITDPFWNNFQLCCNTCNQTKGTMTIERWNAWLAKTRARNLWVRKREKEVSRPRLIPDTVAQANNIIQAGEHQLPF